MRTHQKHIKYLQLFNVMSFTLILITIIYGWITINSLPENLRIVENRAGSNGIWINKSVIREDIRLMVITYLVISLICVYMQLTPFKDGSGKHKAIMIPTKPMYFFGFFFDHYWHCKRSLLYGCGQKSQVCDSLNSP